MRRTGLTLAGILIVALVAVLLLTDRGATPPPPPAEPPIDPAPASLPEEPEPEVSTPPAEAEAEPEPAEAVLTVLARGGELPWKLVVTVDGVSREVAFGPFARPDRREVRLPEARPGSALTVAAEGFVSATAVLDEAGLRAEAVLLAHAEILAIGAGKSTQSLTLRVRIGEEERTATLTPPGYAKIDGLPPGTHRLEVLAGPRFPLGARTVELEPGEREKVDLDEMALGRLVRGTTVNERGDPVRRARILVRAQGLVEGYVMASTEATSDDRGRFGLLLAPGLTYGIEASKRGGGSTGLVVLELAEEEPEEPETLELVIRSGSEVKGIVVDEKGRPLAGVLVVFLKELDPGKSGVRPSRRMTTGEDGRFEFDDFPTGSTVVLRFMKKGRAVSPLPAFEVRPGLPEFRIVLPPEVPFEVRIVDADTGGPVDAPTLWASAVRVDDDGRRAAEILSTERLRRGRFLVHGHDGALPVELFAISPAHRQNRHETTPASGGPVVYSLEPKRGIVLAGKVVDSDGSPVANARVWASCRDELTSEERATVSWSDYASSGPDGRVTLRGLTEGTRYLVRASVDRNLAGAVGSASAPFWFRAKPGREVTLTIVTTGGAQARVQPEDPTTPVVCLMMRVVRMVLDGKGETEPDPAANCALGNKSVSLDGLLPGEYTLAIGSNSHLPVTIEGVRVEAGRTTDLGEFVLREGAAVDIRLLDHAGRPLVGARVWAIAEDGFLRIGRKTDADGRTRLRRLRSISYTLVATGEGMATMQIRSLTVTDAPLDPIEHRVPEPGRLVVRVTAGGRARSGRVVEVRSVAPPPLDRVLVDGITRRAIWFGSKPTCVWDEVEHRSGADGTVEIGPLAPGEYRVGDRTVAVRPGETTTVDVESP